MKTRRIVTGTLVESARFRFIFFRRKYGSFGSFILPFYLLRVVLSPLLVLLLLVSLAWYLIMLPIQLLGLTFLALILGVLIAVPQFRRRLKTLNYSATGVILGTILGLLDYAFGQRSPVWKSVK